MFNKVALFREKLMPDDMARHGLMMVAFGLLMGLFNYLYQLSMGIMLTPAQYGTLYSLLAMLTILSIFSQTIQTVLTKFTSKFKSQGKLGGVKYIWQFLLKRAFLLGLVVFLALALFTPFLSRFLNIDNYWYIIILSSSFLFVFVLPVNYGVLRGMQRFLPLGLSGTLSTFLRLAMAVLLVYFGFGVYGGLLPNFISPLIIIFVTLYFLRDLRRAGSERIEFGGFFQYTGLTFLAIVCFTVLTNVDVILAKHFLRPVDVGNYSVISVLGKIALFLPGGLVVALFPKTSDLSEIGVSHRAVLLRAVLLTLFLAGGVVIVYWFFPELIVNFLFSTKYTMVIPYLFRYGLAMFLFAFSFLLMNYFLSLNQTGVAYALLGVVVLQIALISIFHDSISQFVDIMLASGILCLIPMLAIYVKNVK